MATLIRLPAALLAVALLLCHGAFGYAHQLELTDVPAPPAAHAGEMGGHHHPASHGTDGGHAAGAYFATLLVLLLGASLLPRFRGPVRATLAVPAPFDRHAPSGVFHPPRGPTLPSLQVFRL